MTLWSDRLMILPVIVQFLVSNFSWPQRPLYNSILLTVFIFIGCNNKLPQTELLKTKKKLFSHSSGSSMSIIKVSVGPYSFWRLWQRMFLCLFLSYVRAILGILQFVDTSLQSLPLSSQKTLPYVSISLFSQVISHWIRVHPNPCWPHFN